MFSVVVLPQPEGPSSATLSAEATVPLAIQTNSTGEVDNLELLGFFQDDAITERDLKNGLFDYASIYVFTINWTDLTQGICRLRRGWIGECTLSPAGIFKAKNHYLIIIAPLDHQFAGLCRAMGRPELATDARFIAENRLANLAELVTLVEDWLQSMPSDEASMATMKEFRVPHAPILSVAEAVEHPHLRQRGTVRTVHDRILGDFDVPGFALRFSKFPERLELDAPMLGEHNEQVLTQYLGYSTARVRELENSGMLRSGPA
jgi:crotonobetainyl-CoA:carnitine CoA-transferase CaiB-like acyl-CoA transferase